MASQARGSSCASSQRFGADVDDVESAFTTDDVDAVEGASTAAAADAEGAAATETYAEEEDGEDAPR